MCGVALDNKEWQIPDRYCSSELNIRVSKVKSCCQEEEGMAVCLPHSQGHSSHRARTAIWAESGVKDRCWFPEDPGPLGPGLPLARPHVLLLPKLKLPQVCGWLLLSLTFCLRH
jgi:hypothetical protein